MIEVNEKAEGIVKRRSVVGKSLQEIDEYKCKKVNLCRNRRFYGKKRK